MSKTDFEQVVAEAMKRESQSAECVKTGCEVWLQEYKCWSRGDAFKIGDVYVFRLISSLIESRIQEKPGEKHYDINKIGLIFDKRAHYCTIICHISAVVDYGYRGTVDF